MSPPLLLLTHSLSYVPFIYTTSRRPEAGFELPRHHRGREVPTYLTYIIDNYDNLPHVTLFLHAYPEQWHNDIVGPYTSDLLPILRMNKVYEHGYVNLRCKHVPGCPNSVNPLSPSASDLKKGDIRALFAEAYMQVFNVTRTEVPEHIGAPCCAQFAASRDTIRARPKSDYERMLEWARTTRLTDDFGVGWMFEQVWHIVFGKDAVHCPSLDECRCLLRFVLAARHPLCREDFFQVTLRAHVSEAPEVLLSALSPCRSTSTPATAVSMSLFEEELQDCGYATSAPRSRLFFCDFAPTGMAEGWDQEQRDRCVRSACVLPRPCFSACDGSFLDQKVDIIDPQ
ncbi:hypothetical protein MRB53_038942 [Persea americana]|nr:hypothetical protein MRB53_038942 [Persea americana]